MTPARRGYVVVAVATSVALAAFVVAALAGSQTLWFVAYAFVLLALGAAFLIRKVARDGRENGL